MAGYVAGLVFLATLIAGAASVAWSVSDGRINLSASAWRLPEVMSGESAVQLAKELTKTPFPTGLADAERAGTWLLTGSLGSRVRRGCEDWLFLEDELVVHHGAAKNVQARLDAVAQVRDLLKRKGIELIVATVPDKSRVQQDQLCSVYRPDSFSDRLKQWEAGLSQRGIPHAALLAPLENIRQGAASQPFLTTDSHWTQAGANAAADALAKAIASLKIKLTPAQQYSLEHGAPEDRQGDLVRLAGIDWLPPRLLPPPDVVAPARIEQKRDGSGSNNSVKPASDADDLFGDANLPSVALLGTSFSRTSSFAPLLEKSLQTPVPNFALDGGDFWGSASKYLSSKEYRDTPPKVVIWEMPERVLQMGISAQEQAWFDHLRTGKSPQSK